MQPARPLQPRDKRGGQGADRQARARDIRELHARTGDTALRGAFRNRAARPDEIQLLRQRLRLSRMRAQNGVPVPASDGTSREDEIHLPLGRLPRRDDRRALRRLPRPLREDIQTDADGRGAHPGAGLLPLPLRQRARRLRRRVLRLRRTAL